jgi:hypothetical protein
MGAFLGDFKEEARVLGSIALAIKVGQGIEVFLARETRSGWGGAGKETRRALPT